MLYFIETKTLINNILARNKLLLSLPSSVNASILNAWEDLQMELEWYLGCFLDGEKLTVGGILS